MTQLSTGVFAGSTGALRTVSDTNTQIPEGVGNFTGFGTVVIQDGLVVFEGSGASGQEGIYVERDGMLNKVIDLSDSLVDGKSLSNFTISEDAVSGADIAFSASFDIGTGNPTNGIFLATIPEPSTALLFATGLIGLAIRRRHVR